MKKQILILALLIGTAFSESLATTEASHATSSALIESQRTEVDLSPRSVSSQIGTISFPIFGPGRYKKRKIQRQNSIDNTNRRARKNLRKNGIGMLPIVKWEEVTRG